MLEQRVKRRNQHPRNLVDLRDPILSEWLKLDPTYLHILVDSLPNRIQAVIKSRGGVTRIFLIQSELDYQIGKVSNCPGAPQAWKASMLF
ncbi:hypothetical protein AVEN_227816-1 [Araneus ventricosus]|uniref:Uncharacterized protein n=1 Tax=Araneus ventricosus TaxID=182803 RepID=A0A4Y2TE41_ARAVE|nr:hypothetical protein AVEN_227816-1 [Araneus ventricosus]